MPKTAGKARVTALYERLSRDDARSAAGSIGLRIANRRFAPRNAGRKSITW